MRVEVDAKKVDETFTAVTKDFQREANLPGFRPGKAPPEMVLRKYGKDIEDEAKRKKGLEEIGVIRRWLDEIERALRDDHHP